MLRGTFFVSVLAVCGVSVWPAGARQEGPPPITAAATIEAFSGAILWVERNRLIVSINGEDRTFLVAADAKILLNGEPATLQDLQPRYAVSILAERNDPPIAKYIDAQMTLAPADLGLAVARAGDAR
jgi:hypothetical protein